MELKFLEYQLGGGGFIQNWLVAGPVAAPIDTAIQDSSPNEAWKIRISRENYDAGLSFSEPPVDRGFFDYGGEKLRWRYVHCRDDHFIHVSSNFPGWRHVRAWALTQVKVDKAVIASLALTAFGPADVWINGEHAFRREDFAQGGPSTTVFQSGLEAGINQLVIRFEQVAAGECPNLLALQFRAIPENDLNQVQVLVPTQAKRPSRWLRLERAFERAYLEQAVSHKGTSFNLRWAEDMAEKVNYAYQVQDAAENIYVEGKWDSNPAEPLDIGHPARLWERPYRVVLQATGPEYWNQDLRYQREIPIQVLDTPYSIAPYGSFASRLGEALEDAAKHETDLFGQIARLQLQRYDKVNPESILEAIQQVNRGEVGKELFLMGLLVIRYRYTGQADFPKGLKKPLEACIKAYLSRISTEEKPVASLAMDQGKALYLLDLTCQLLALQLYPKRKPGQTTSAQIQETVEKSLMDWILRLGQTGFGAWDSCSEQEMLVVGLTHLVSLAANPMVKDTAAVLLDKLFFGMAISTYKGANGASQGDASAEAMKSAQLQATSGIQRILWGTGVYNHHIAGTVSLACSDYEFPLPIANIAANLPEQAWSRERDFIDPDGKNAVDRVLYRTPDYLLASAQDYRPGERGFTEHIWQATLGPDALVFVNHPASLGEHEALKPGFWRGNSILPRVAQWKDVLIAVHKLPVDVWLGFTHAFMPAYCFDDCLIDGNWAFARQGNGYLALTARRGIELVKRAPDAYRELRSYGSENTWVCMLGRQAQDGSFDDFMRKVKVLDVKWRESSVSLATLRSETLDFGWEGALTVNGVEQPLKGNKHIDSPYCTADLPAAQMDITDGENIMRLNFS